MKNSKKWLSLGLSVLIAMISLTSPTFAVASMASNSEAIAEASDIPISTYAYKYVWKYKAVNGLLQKRLYNLTLDRYEGDWMPM